MLFAQLVVLFHLFNTKNRAPRTAEFYDGQLKKLLPSLGGLDCLELRPYHLLELKSTWHLVLSLQRLYRWAVEEQQILPTNPLLKLVRPRLGARSRTLTPLEGLRFLRASRLDFRRFLFAARETAARPQELRTLEWPQLRWEGGFPALEGALRAGECYFELLDYKGKNRRTDPGETRIIPVSPRLGRLLWRLARGHSLQGLIFRTDKGKHWTRNSLRLRMGRVRQRVDVPLTAGGEKIVCYSWRHSTATELAGQGMQTSILQLLLGHAHIKTTQRYLHVRKKHLLDAWRIYHQPDSLN